MSQKKSTERYKSFIHELAVSASVIIKSYFRKPMQVNSKEDNTPVTNADRETEAYLRDRIGKEFPDHGIVGEEYGSVNSRAEFTWVLDPIDGTKSFVCGAATFGTLIGLLHNQEPLLGAIYLPVLDEFLIGDGKNTWLNGSLVRMRSCQKLSHAILLSSDSAELYARCPALFKQVRFHRGLGDCYGYYLLATGFADIMIDLRMSPWDLLPLIPVIRGAGGNISGIGGESAENADSAVAAFPLIHQNLIQILNSP